MIEVLGPHNHAPVSFALHKDPSNFSQQGLIQIRDFSNPMTFSLHTFSQLTKLILAFSSNPVHRKLLWILLSFSAIVLEILKRERK